MLGNLRQSTYTHGQLSVVGLTSNNLSNIRFAVIESSWMSYYEISSWRISVNAKRAHMTIQACPVSEWISSQLTNIQSTEYDSIKFH